MKERPTHQGGLCGQSQIAVRKSFLSRKDRSTNRSRNGRQAGSAKTRTMGLVIDRVG